MSPYIKKSMPERLEKICHKNAWKRWHFRRDASERQRLLASFNAFSTALYITIAQLAMRITTSHLTSLLRILDVFDNTR